MEQTKDMLETLISAQVLTLATVMKDIKKKGGIQSSNDFTSEAVQLIARKRPEILRLLQQHLQA